MRTIAVFYVLFAVQQASAAVVLECRGITVFDFRRAENKQAAESKQEKNRAFFLPEIADYDSATSRSVFAHANDAFRRTAGGVIEIEKTDPLLADIDSGVAAAATRDRVITLKGDIICNVAIFDSGDQTPTFSPVEATRPTRFQQDLTTLRKLMPAAPQGETTVQAIGSVYQLVQLRGTLTVTAKQSPIITTTTNAAGQQSESGDDAKETTLTVSVTTGPGEHLFIGLDVPLTKAKDLNIDKTQHTVDIKQKPNDYYGSLSWQLGDLFSDYPTSYGKNLVLKGFFNLSRTPRSSYGGGLGYRLPAINRYGFELKDVSPFAGYFHSTTTATVDGKQSDVRRNSWRWGVSFNLDKALTWTSAKKE